MVLETTTGNIYGTITIPAGFSKGTLAIIIAGSGPTDRNGNSTLIKGKNNSLQMLAYGLSDAGIAACRFDKRGIGESRNAMGKEADLRFDTYVKDVADWIVFLKKDKRFKKVVVIGHSEGSLIGMIAAKENADKYISVSGAGKRADILIKEQLEKQPEKIKAEAFSILDSLAMGYEVKAVSKMFYSLFRPSVQPYMISWFKHDPQLEISKLNIPILITQGDNDLQVSVSDAKLLAASNNKSSLKIIPGMNHVLKVTSTDALENQMSYGNPDLPISTDLLQSIIEFIKK
jgi:hypothetical protein